MDVNTLLKVLEQLLHKIKANRRREMVEYMVRMRTPKPMQVYDFAAAPNHRCKI